MNAQQSRTLTTLFHAAPPACLGRLQGAKAQVVRDARLLGVRHFVFVRSSILGLDLRDAPTFAGQKLIDGVVIEVVSELAGHANIDATSIYATQELARKIKAVRGMKRRVAA